MDFKSFLWWRSHEALTVIAREERRREKETEETQRQRRMMWNVKDWNWGGNSNIGGKKGQTEED